MPEALARELEIHIRRPDGDGAYPVEMRVPSDDLRAEGQFRPPYADAEIERALGFIESGAVDAAYVQEFGARLFAALFGGTLRALYAAAR